MNDANSPPPYEQVVTSPSSGVRRVNNRPVLIVVGIVVVFVLVLVVVIAGRGKDINDAGSGADTESRATRSASESAALKMLGDSAGIVPEAAPPAPLAMPMSVPIAPVDAGEGPPVPPQPQDPEAERARALWARQVQTALQARTGVIGTKPAPAAGSAVAAPARANAGSSRDASAPGNSVGSEELAALRAAMQGAGDGEDSKPDNNLGQFAASAGQAKDRWLLDSKVELPRSRYTLRAGFVIPGVMISGINSDLPGQIIGQVSQDVYDTATGRHRIIPQGTRLVGAYSDDVAYGQRRVLVAWQRLVFPDGRAMDIGAMAGADSIGASGFKDKVNNHYMRLFGNALMLTGIIAGVEYSQRGRGSSSIGGADDFGSTLSASLGQTLGQAMTAQFRKNMNISPTLEVRPGFRFNVMVTKDLDFDRPYTPLTY